MSDRRRLLRNQQNLWRRMMDAIIIARIRGQLLFFLQQVNKSGEPLTLLKNGTPFTRILLSGFHREIAKRSGS